MTTNHARFMQRALSLAQKGKGKVHPNPLVGCVLVKNGKIIGEGHHARYGGPHAEIVALQKAGSHAKGSTLYINLEPCAHWGKTPPCAPALIEAGIREAFISLKDPNPSVNGKGIALLKKAGIRVHLGLEKAAAEVQNRAFLTWKRENRPYTILKMAVSLDGKTAAKSGDSRWISSPVSRKLVHTLRAESDAVLIGANTAILDNPLLTSHGRGRNPIRVVLDPHLRTSPRLKIYSSSRPPTWVIASNRAKILAEKKLELKGVKILRESLKYGSINPIKIVKLLSKNNVSQLLIEGGGNTSWSFISKNVVDEILLFVAPIIIGGSQAKTAVDGAGIDSISKAFKLKSMTVGRLGPDIIIRGLFK